MILPDAPLPEILDVDGDTIVDTTAVYDWNVVILTRIGHWKIQI